MRFEIIHENEGAKHIDCWADNGVCDDIQSGESYVGEINNNNSNDHFIFSPAKHVDIGQHDMQRIANKLFELND